MGTSPKTRALQDLAKAVTAAPTGEERFKAYVGLLSGMLAFHAQGYMKDALAAVHEADASQVGTCAWMLLLHWRCGCCCFRCCCCFPFAQCACALLLSGDGDMVLWRSFWRSVTSGSAQW